MQTVRISSYTFGDNRLWRAIPFRDSILVEKLRQRRKFWPSGAEFMWRWLCACTTNQFSVTLFQCQVIGEIYMKLKWDCIVRVKKDLRKSVVTIALFNVYGGGGGLWVKYWAALIVSIKWEQKENNKKRETSYFRAMYTLKTTQQVTPKLANTNEWNWAGPILAFLFRDCFSATLGSAAGSTKYTSTSPTIF